MLASNNVIRRLVSDAKTLLPRSAFTTTTVVSTRACFHSSPRRHGLSAEQKEIVKSTAPVLSEHGIAITTHFYKRMLDNHPELKNIFNSAHQSTGAQPAALAHAVWAYAVNTDQYPIVGENLLASIREVLGDAVDKPVLDAWEAAYQQLADIFIGFERDLYHKAAQTPGGWNGWRKFKVSQKVHESEEIISFYLEPLDAAQLPQFKSGQYISVRVFMPELGVHQPRQYTLSGIPAGTHFRISVKKEAAKGVKPAGLISNVLHDKLPEGSELEVSMPYGDFTLDVDADVPVVLISGGVGITPMLSMIGTVTEHAKNRPVVFVHAARNGKVHAMKDYLSNIMQENHQVSRAIFYEEVADSDKKGVDYDYEGRIDLAKIRDQVLLPGANYYLCGPIPFMQTQQKSLEALGVPKDRIHSEVFGSGVA